MTHLLQPDVLLIGGIYLAAAVIALVRVAGWARARLRARRAAGRRR